MMEPRPVWDGGAIDPTGETETGDVAIRRRISHLGNGLLVLAAVGLVEFAVEHADAPRAVLRAIADLLGGRMPTPIPGEPVDGLRALWPLAIAAAVRWRKRPELLPASAVTFGLLAVDRVASIGLNLAALVVAGGSRTRLPLASAPHPSLPLLLLGAMLAGCELVATLKALSLAPRSRSGGQSERSGPREAPAIAGRLAAWVAVAFALLVGGTRGWGLYQDALLLSPSLRGTMLQFAPRFRPRAPRSPSLGDEGVWRDCSSEQSTTRPPAGSSKHPTSHGRLSTPFARSTIRATPLPPNGSRPWPCSSTTWPGRWPPVPTPAAEARNSPWSWPNAPSAWTRPATPGTPLARPDTGRGTCRGPGML